MRWAPGRAWRRSRVSTRIAAAIVMALVCVLLLAILQYLVTPRPQWVLYEARWLVAATEEAAAVAFGKTPAERNRALRDLSASQWLHVTWQQEAPEFAVNNDEPEHPFSSQLAATLTQVLHSRAKSVVVSFAPPGGHRGRVVFRPPGAEGSPPPGVMTVKGGPPPLPRPEAIRFAPPPQGGPEMPVPALFRIAIQGGDGTWLTVAPAHHGEASPLWRWPLLPLIGGTLAVAAISALTARRILAPLDGLTRAAQRLGTERNPVPISSAGLGEFSAIADAFNDMQARLERFVGDRTQMLAAISHDLRTSLTRLKLAIEEIEDGEQKRVMARETDEMDAMISATLSFARADANREASRNIDVASLLISLCDEATDRGAYAQYQGPDHARLRCQPIAMKRALINVIDNAVKYGHRACVSLEMAAASAIIRVSDDGPGIAPERMEEAFAPFRRLEASRNRETGGVGLGLTIARDAVQAHGGTIRLSNGAPRGLVVAITLPTG